MLYKDTRQQKGKHALKERWWDEHGVESETRKLDFGDYMADGSNVSVDTKASIAEVARNLTAEHDRFARECDRAAEAGYRLVVLVEAGGRYQSIGSLAAWTSDVCKRCPAYRGRKCRPRMKSQRCVVRGRKPVQGDAVAKAMASFQDRHGVRFEFCRKEETAARVCELLGIEVDGDGA